jgi:deoxyribodipyrimidine photo-lyase
MLVPVPPVCVWLKRDLRVNDHPALAEACTRARGGAVFALFLYEPEVLAQAEWDSSHTEFQRECLVDIEASLARLGIRLVTRRGEAVTMLEELRRETGYRLIVAHEETGTGVTYARDRRVRRWARESGVEFVELPQTGVVRRLRSRNGWNRLWENRMQAVCAPLAHRTASRAGASIVRLTTAGILGCRELGQPADTKDRQGGGEAAARAVLDDFLGRRGRSYCGGISSPLSAPTSCSRLSPFLAWGAISMRTVWQASEVRRREVNAALAAAAGPRERSEMRAWQRSLNAVQSRLHWHCHFMQKLEDEPAIEFHNMLRAADGLRENEVSADRLAAWQAGRTGYPLVDACMRSLLATGWLTFRMRAMVVSFQGGEAAACHGAGRPGCPGRGPRRGPAPRQSPRSARCDAAGSGAAVSRPRRGGEDRPRDAGARPAAKAAISRRRRGARRLMRGAGAGRRLRKCPSRGYVLPRSRVSA